MVIGEGMFDGQHYQFFAEEIRKGIIGQFYADYFVGIFANDNEKFNPDIFWTAAGLPIYFTIYKQQFGIVIKRHPGIFVAFLQGKDAENLRKSLTPEMLDELDGIHEYVEICELHDEMFQIVAGHWVTQGGGRQNE